MRNGLAAPVVLEGAKAAGLQAKPKQAGATPACDKKKAAGQWTTACDPCFELDPKWTEAHIAAGPPVYIGNVFSPKLSVLLSIAFNASTKHIYVPGSRGHILVTLRARRDADLRPTR
jgi:hypothetical protein